MRENNYEILKQKRHCPICNEEHEMELRLRIVEDCEVFTKTVKYIEAYFYCKKYDYEVLEFREVQEVHEDE